MLKRFSIKKIFISTAALFALFLLYIIPSTNEKNLTNTVSQELTYVDENIKKHEIFL